MAEASKVVVIEEGKLPSHDDIMAEDKPEGESASEDLLKEEETTEEETSEEKKSEETTEDEKTEESEKTEPTSVVDPLDEIRDNLAEVTSSLRDERAKTQALEDKLTAQGDKLREQGILEEEDPAVAQKLADARDAYTEKISLLYETMAVNPTYEDIDDVVSEANQEALFRVYSQELASRDNVSVTDAEVTLNEHIRSQRNPVKWWYDNITGLLSDPADEQKSSEKEGSKNVKDAKETLKEVVVPSSTGNMGGVGETPKGPWTTSKIDGMGEDLSAVPEDVLEKYLSGSLQ